MSADTIMRAAVVKRRGEGSPLHSPYMAYIPEIAHVAFADGRTPDHALAELRRGVSRNLPRVIAAWEILGAAKI